MSVDRPVPFRKSFMVSCVSAVVLTTLLASSRYTPSTVELERTVVFLAYMVTVLPSMSAVVDTLNTTWSFTSSYSPVVVLEVVEA